MEPTSLSRPPLHPSLSLQVGTRQGTRRTPYMEVETQYVEGWRGVEYKST